MTTILYMARRLDTDEQHLFFEALSTSENAIGGTVSDGFLKMLQDRREAALELTPELENWLDPKPNNPFLP
ncbi:MAG TPA: hypothetical protein VLT36_16985 [Candidatus Dormibacteraeota bacterium]|nr:hypothetical protein [Candidatus Dormibacteraeota bacterium]